VFGLSPVLRQLNIWLLLAAEEVAKCNHPPLVVVVVQEVIEPHLGYPFLLGCQSQ
jgi:hypothetical protein